MTAFLYSFDGKLHCIDVENTVISSGEQLRNFASSDCESISGDELFLTHNGQLIHKSQNIKLRAGSVYRACLRLPGGKGGFGSMLRALGAQIEKTTNREACRDLSGRRMRDVNDEKKIADWVEKQAEREREAAKKKQEKLDRLRGGQVQKFDDGTYTKQIQGNADRIHNALQQGLKAASGSSTASGSGEQKRKAEEIEKPGAKKKRLWLGLDDLESDEDDDMEIQKYSSHTCAPSSGTASSSTSTCTTTKDSDEPCTSTTVKENQQESSEHRTTSEQPSSSTETPSHTNTNDSCITNPDSTEYSSADSQKPSVAQEETAVALETHETKPVCLADYNSAEELEALGLDCLKSQLMLRGLKCGGTLQQRAQRLFTTKTVPLDKLDTSFFAKPPNGKKKTGKR